MAQRIEQRPPLDEEHEIQAQLERYPRLSHEEERRLLSTHGADRDAANRVLIEHNLHLVLEAAQARKGRGVAFGDLFQEGTVGLISAVEHYKPADGAFHARLVHVIAVTMDDVLAQTDEAQRNDEAFVIACRLLESAQRLLSERLDRPATPAELAKLLQWDEARVNVMLAMLGETRTTHDQELLDYLDDLDDPEDHEE
ncbi:MAG: polymerase primary sigma factor [Chloroflexota bacterium]|nr:polymerase primary sigma factor [Chloroflexota bacterium]